MKKGIGGKIGKAQYGFVQFWAISEDRLGAVNSLPSKPSRSSSSAPSSDILRNVGIAE